MDAAEMEKQVVFAAKALDSRRDPPLAVAMDLTRCVVNGLPSPELAHALVSSLFSSLARTPALWKLLDQALASRLVSPLHTLALLTPRVVPNRRTQPEAYRLYLELLNRYVLLSASMMPGQCRDKITKSIFEALQISERYGCDNMEYGHAVVFFFLSVITSLIDGALEDCGLRSLSMEKEGNICDGDGHQLMDIDSKASSDDRWNEHREQLFRSNSRMAIEVAMKITANKKVKLLLHFMHLNMHERFNSLLQRLQLIELQKSKSQSLISADQHLHMLLSNIKEAMNEAHCLDKHQLFGVLVDAGSYVSTSGISSGVSRATCWVAFDIFMENAMDARHLYAISTIEILTELTRTLRVINRASWQETFQALWISALRLVQREREPLEGPMPHLDARLCILLSIVPLSMVPIMEEDDEISRNMRNASQRQTETDNYASRRNGLNSSLQLLSQFSGLLSPPPSVVTAANDAASKAASFIYNFKNGSSNLTNVGQSNASAKAAGSMLHLIVEACVARKLIDTSAYLWPGYVTVSSPVKDSLAVHESPWSAFMDGAPLTGSLKSSLMAIPASSIAEVERLYHVALNGSEEEKSAAAKILCGATLLRGWNIQEYAVRIVVKLLSPLVPPELSETEKEGHLIGHMAMLHPILFGVSGVDIVHILSLYGMVPEVAAALMPLCEAFGSISPTSSQKPSTSQETSAYTVFSCAFLSLLRLWKFYRPPQEHCIGGRGATIKMELTLDCLLLMHNSRASFHNSTFRDRNHDIGDLFSSSSGQPVYIASFPKLRSWYFQNQACVASTLSGLCSKNPAHQVANNILKMICRKMTSRGSSSNPTSTSGSSMSSSPANSAEDTYQRPVISAWEVLEAVPFVLEALLSACAHGRLSSRDLTTGLRDLVDYLPASLATIISYFSAEITRGIWKPVPMNGTDWPSPTTNLLSVESEVKDILASVGVHFPRCNTCGTAPVMLPLPMAALVSLTITFKLDKSLDYIQALIGQALENCAAGCSWHATPIIGALWTQKVRRWHDFIVFSCSRSPFSYDKDAIAQLVRSCFSSFLGPSVMSSSHLMAGRGVNGLLGLAIAEQGVRLPIAPGFLYLRSCRQFHDTHFVSNLILGLVVKWAQELGSGWACNGPARLRSGRISLATAAARVREVATLGASLLCIAGGLLLVQVLYEETLPTSLLTAKEGRSQDLGPTALILQGYAMAYMLILSGAFVWGISDTSPAYTSVFSSKRARIIGKHMDFVARVVEGNITLGCDPTTLKAYVSCLVRLLVGYVPAWVPQLKQETLQRLASGLRRWQEPDLALALLARGGPDSMASVVESIL